MISIQYDLNYPGSPFHQRIHTLLDLHDGRSVKHEGRLGPVIAVRMTGWMIPAIEIQVHTIKHHVDLALVYHILVCFDVLVPRHMDQRFAILTSQKHFALLNLLLHVRETCLKHIEEHMVPLHRLLHRLHRWSLTIWKCNAHPWPTYCNNEPESLELTCLKERTTWNLSSSYLVLTSHSLT